MASHREPLKQLNNKDKRRLNNKKLKENYIADDSKDRKLPSNFKKIFSAAEAREIIENLLKKRKSDARIYTLIGLWLSNFLTKSTFRQLRTALGGNVQIDVMNFHNNTDKVKSVIHFLISSLIEEKEVKPSKKTVEALNLDVNEKFYRSVALSVDWDTFKDEQILSYVHVATYYALFQAGESFFRSPEVARLISPEMKKPTFKEILRVSTEMGDMCLNLDKTIKAVQNLGISDADIFRYRYIRGFGDADVYVNLDADSESFKNYRSDLNNQSCSISIKQKIYNEIFAILNSNVLPRIERDAIKMVYKIPTASSTQSGEEYILTPQQFFAIHKEQIKVLKKKYKSVTDQPFFKYDPEHFVSSSFFKEALSKMKEILLERFGDEEDGRDLLSDFLSDSASDFEEI